MMIAHGFTIDQTEWAREYENSRYLREADDAVLQ
jgi:hypothetical protein